MQEIAGWIAPIATMIAATMTASNLGPRVTGWGFALFTVGSLAWVAIAVATGQPNLLWANGFLTLVNLVGIWRWLGRVAFYEAGSRKAQARSRGADVATLFPVTSLIDRPVVDGHGVTIGRSVGAMARCDGGGIAYLIVAEGGVGGVGERLHAVAWAEMTIHGDVLSTRLDAVGLAALPRVDPQEWPQGVPRHAA